MDDLERRILNAKPCEEAPLPEHANRLLADIVSGRRKPQFAQSPRAAKTSFARQGLITIALAGAVALTSLLVIAYPFEPQQAPAVAVTPRPLHVYATELTISKAREELASVPTPLHPSPTRDRAVSEGWYVQLEESAGEFSGFIQPQENILTLNKNLTVTTLTSAGTPVSIDGAPLHPIPAEATTPGAVLFEGTEEPGSYVPEFHAEPPTTVTGMRTYLERYLIANGYDAPIFSAGDYLGAYVTLRDSWPLSDFADRQALQVILGAPGVDVAGAVTDRAGRPGIAFNIAATKNDATHRDQLIVDPVKWQTLSAERVYAGGIPELPLAPSSIRSYTLWR